MLSKKKDTLTQKYILETKQHLQKYHWYTKKKIEFPDPNPHHHFQDPFMMWSKSQLQDGLEPQAELYTHLLSANATGLWVFERGILLH